MSDERKENGGPAFPVADVHQESYGGGVYGPVTTDYTAGMSLRDYFAGQALAGLVPNAAWDYNNDPFYNTEAAKRCYAIADAMLAARKDGER